MRSVELHGHELITEVYGCMGFVAYEVERHSRWRVQVTFYDSEGEIGKRHDLITGHRQQVMRWLCEAIDAVNQWRIAA